MSARLLASQHARLLAPLVIRLVSRFVSNLLTTLGMRTMGSSDFIAAFVLKRKSVLIRLINIEDSNEEDYDSLLQKQRIQYRT